jgi:TolB-like protein
MTDEPTTDLARISSLKVISETSAMRYRGNTRLCSKLLRNSMSPL